MAKELPQLNRASVVEAARRIDAGGGSAFGTPTGYEVELDGMRYAPKALVGIAAGIVSGEDFGPGDFSGGEGTGQANTILRDLGFTVRSIAPMAPGFGPGTLSPGQTYTRRELRALGGVAGEKGGDFDTGYASVGREWVIFANLGPSRTGHEYANRWDGTTFVWYGKTRSAPDDKRISAMVGGDNPVRLFTREHDRDPWLYHGEVKSITVEDRDPVCVRWRVLTGEPAGTELPNELDPGVEYREGAVRQITVNAYERDPKARAACIAHWGCRCYCCGLLMAETYGPVADGFIHAHHLRPVSELGPGYQTDPVADLRPLCPNCHAIVHLSKPAMGVDELRSMLRS